MRRIPVDKRPDATRLVQSQGLVYSKTPSSPSGEREEPYWPDDRYYSFTRDEIALLEQAGNDVYAMCREATDHLIANPDLLTTYTTKLGIPAFALPQIKQSWERNAWGSIYGRFDVCFGGLDHPDPRLRVPKFYEFNAERPLLLVESASIQWLWLEETGHGNDQFNSITERLIAAWKRNLTLIEQELGHPVKVVHFAFARGTGESSGEDAMTTALLMDTCQQAGWPTKVLFMEQLSISSDDGRVYDRGGEHIDVIFKLYPWVDMIKQKFGEVALEDMGRVGLDGGGETVWIEPPYKMLWSNKALFALLWHLFENDPRSRWLLPTYFDNEAPASLTADSCARKPIFAGEGDDIVLQEDGRIIQDTTSAGGRDGKKGGYVVQELAMPPEFKSAEADVSYYPIVSLWVVDGEVVGMGIREDKTPITVNGSAVFVPHSISDGPVSYDRRPIPDVGEVEALLEGGQSGLAYN